MLLMAGTVLTGACSLGAGWVFEKFQIDAATDQSRTSGLVTSGPKRMCSVCSMHMAMAA